MRLIYGHIAVRAGSRIRIRNSNAPKALSPDHPGLLSLLPLRIKQRVRRERVPVRPAIHGNAFDVARRIESRSPEHARQLVSYVALKSAERSLHQFHAPGAMLIAWRKSRAARGSQHEQHHGLFRIAGK